MKGRHQIILVLLFSLFCFSYYSSINYVKLFYDSEQI